MGNICIAIIDDDDSVRRALERLLRAHGYAVKVFAGVDEFLSAAGGDPPACVIVDVRMPGKTGLDLFASLSASGVEVGVIFITGHGDLPMIARTSRARTVGLLAKPFEDRALLSAIDQCLEQTRPRGRTPT